MLNEGRKIIENIKNLRKFFLNEGVSEGTLIDAINKREILYLYYDGDKTQMRGYRIVVPFVLGVAKESQNRLLRAWQLEGNSDSFIPLNPPGRKRKDHEYFNDNVEKTSTGWKETNKTGTKIGWRLFDIDKISRVLPTGRQYVDEETGKLMTPPLYHANDEQMTGGIIASAPEAGGVVTTTGMDSPIKPDGEITTTDKSTFDKQSDRMKQFYQKPKEIQPADIEKLYNLITYKTKKATKNYIVYRNKNGEFLTTNVKNESKIPAEYVVGNLKDLYNKYVVPTKPKTSSFIDKERNDLKRELQKPNMEENNMEIKTFFKN